MAPASSIAYFQDDVVTEPLLMLSAWAVVGAAITLLMPMRRKPDDDATRTGTAPDGSAIT